METTHPLRVLVRPRTEFPRVLDLRSAAWFPLLAALKGLEVELSGLYEKASPERAARPFGEVFALHAVLGGVGGIAALALLAVLIATATRLMKHPIDNRSARAIVGWASLPSLLPLTLLLGMFAAQGSELLRLGSEHVKAAAPSMWWGVLVLQLVGSLWSLVLAVLGISALSKLSVVRAVAAYLVASVTFWALLNFALFALQWAAPTVLESLATFHRTH
jgi:Yip1-like protein